MEQRAGGGNRTLVASLEDWNSAIELRRRVRLKTEGPHRHRSVHHSSRPARMTALAVNAAYPPSNETWRTAIWPLSSAGTAHIVERALEISRIETVLTRFHDREAAIRFIEDSSQRE